MVPLPEFGILPVGSIWLYEYQSIISLGQGHPNEMLMGLFLTWVSISIGDPQHMLGLLVHYCRLSGLAYWLMSTGMVIVKAGTPSLLCWYVHFIMFILFLVPLGLYHEGVLCFI